jgi:tetratricopeptide (TPR) repeat protein
MFKIDNLAEFDRLYEKLYESPSTVFIYAVLAEMTRMLDRDQNYRDDFTSGDAAAVYTFIADKYLYLGHYTLAEKYYDKALTLCDQAKQEEYFIEICTGLFEIYDKLKRREEEKQLSAKIKAVMPSALDDIKYQGSMYKYSRKEDPVEYTEKYLDILIELETKIGEAVKDTYPGRGFCHRYWRVKEEILKKDYGIKWKSPAKMNPGVMFD